MAGVLIVAARVAGGVGFGKSIVARLNGLIIVERIKYTKAMIDWRIRAQWDPGLKMLRDYPLTGVGMGGFIIEAANYTEFYKATNSVPESAENYLLQVGSELGMAGLLAVLWLIGALFHEIRTGFREKARAEDRGRAFLARGIAFGVLAFALDAQLHSFIGSYEIKYTLWLFVGLLFALSRGPEDVPASEGAAIGSDEPEQSGAKIRFPRRYRPVVAVLALAAFGLIHLWNSTHSLSMRSRSETLGLVQDFGLYPAEKSPDGGEFRWTREYGAIPLKAGIAELALSIRAGRPDVARKPIKVGIYFVKGLFRSRRLLKDVILGDAEWTTVPLTLGEKTHGEALLLLEVDRTWNLRKEGGADDPRNLGVAVRRAEGLGI